MTYQTVTLLSQYIAFVLFIGLFIGVLIYAFKPGNKKQFDQAANIPLGTDSNDPLNGKNNG